VDPLVILGCGFVGHEVARLALSDGSNVIGTTRGPPPAGGLLLPGFETRVVPVLTREIVRSLVPGGGRVLVAFPPDGQTDAEIAPALASARVVYLSTTGVYGGARGRVDESTDVDASEPRALLRLTAERAYLDRGATVLRAAGIYGPGRGLHRRLLGGDFRIPGAGTNVVSRIHVTDLARLTLRRRPTWHRWRNGLRRRRRPCPANRSDPLAVASELPIPPEAPVDNRPDPSPRSRRRQHASSAPRSPVPELPRGPEARLTAEGSTTRFAARPERTREGSATPE
jgi:hypothetical protein